MLKLWSSDQGRAPEAQALAVALAAANSAAALGRYDTSASAPRHPSTLVAGDSLKENFRGWGGGAPPA